MNNFYIILLYVFAFSICDTFASTHLIGNSDANGYAYIEKRLNDFKDEIPMDLLFSTDPEVNFETYFGTYWYIPIMSTRVFDSGNGYVTWITPTTEKVFFKKEGKSEKLTDRGKVWTCILNKNSITISSLRTPTCFIYKLGRLHTAQINNNYYKFYYSQGKLAKIHKNNDLYASFSYLKNYLSRIYFPITSNKYDFKYTVTNINEFPLLIKVLQNDKSIFELKYSKGVAEKKNNNYFNDNVKVNTPTEIYRITISTSTSAYSNHWIEWDAASGILSKDSSGVYCIGSYIKNKNISYIAYKSNFLDHPEVVTMDYANAIKTHQNPYDGIMTKTSYVGAPGKSYMQIRKKEVRSNKSNKWDLIFSRIYDNNGRLIREMNSKNEMKEWRYPQDKDNGTYYEIVNGITVKTREYKSGKIFKEMQLINGDIYELLHLDTGFLVTKNGKKIEM